MWRLVSQRPGQGNSSSSFFIQRQKLFRAQYKAFKIFSFLLQNATTAAATGSCCRKSCTRIARVCEDLGISVWPGRTKNLVSLSGQNTIATSKGFQKGYAGLPQSIFSHPGWVPETYRGLAEIPRFQRILALLLLGLRLLVSVSRI